MLQGACVIRQSSSTSNSAPSSTIVLLQNGTASARCAAHASQLHHFFAHTRHHFFAHSGIIQFFYIGTTIFTITHQIISAVIIAASALPQSCCHQLYALFNTQSSRFNTYHTSTILFSPTRFTEHLLSFLLHSDFSFLFSLISRKVVFPHVRPFAYDCATTHPSPVISSFSSTFLSSFLKV
jgi:hypothetical protein